MASAAKTAARRRRRPRGRPLLERARPFFTLVGAVFLGVVGAALALQLLERRAS